MTAGAVRIFRFEVPVDGSLHRIRLWGDPLSVSCRQPSVVEFWAFDVAGAGKQVRTFYCAPTGHHLDYAGEWRHWGTAIEPDGYLVWHLLELLTLSIPNQQQRGETP